MRVSSFKREARSVAPDDAKIVVAVVKSLHVRGDENGIAPHDAEPTPSVIHTPDRSVAPHHREPVGAPAKYVRTVDEVIAPDYRVPPTGQEIARDRNGGAAVVLAPA